MILLTFLLTTVALGSTGDVKDVNLPDHRCDLMLKENGLHRDTNGIVNSNGVRLGQVENALLPLARHHIIPYNIIYDFLEAAIDRAPEWMPTEEIGETFSFGQYLDNLVRERLTIIYRDKSTNKGIIRALQQTAKLTTDLAQHKFDPTKSQTIELKMIQAFFFWLPGNLIMGPSPMERIDDPESGPDHRILMIVKENSGERAADVLTDLYHHMVAYTGQTEYFDLLDGTYKATTLRRIVELLTEVSTNAVYPFSFDEWETIMDPDTNIRRYRVRDISNTTSNKPVFKRRVNYAIDNCDGEDKFKYDIVDIIANYVVPDHPELMVSSKPG